MSSQERETGTRSEGETSPLRERALARRTATIAATRQAKEVENTKRIQVVQKVIWDFYQEGGYFKAANEREEFLMTVIRRVDKALRGQKAES